MSQLELITLMGCHPPVTRGGCWTRLPGRRCCAGEFPGRRAEDEAEGMRFAHTVVGGAGHQGPSDSPLFSVFISYDKG